MASDNLIWAYLIHLSYNMWYDREVPELGKPWLTYRPYMRVDEPLWFDLTERLSRAGANMLVIDVGDAVKYDSRPEIAVDRAWTIPRLKRELARLRDIGLEPIPKLNFSATHDAWLGPYARCLSTPAYYQVCRDLIRELCEVFECPRLFHIGMDEETLNYQRHHAYAVVRQFELWWHDFLFCVHEVEENGSRAWIWSDYFWEHHDEFIEKMPRSVMQSNWYYGMEFDEAALREKKHFRAYLELDEHGYDQIPTGSNWVNNVNFEQTVRFCRERISADHLKGFLQTVWMPTEEEWRGRHLEAIEQLERARREWKSTA